MTREKNRRTAHQLRCRCQDEAIEHTEAGGRDSGKQARDQCLHKSITIFSFQPSDKCVSHNPFQDRTNSRRLYFSAVRNAKADDTLLVTQTPPLSPKHVLLPFRRAFIRKRLSPFFFILHSMSTLTAVKFGPKK